MTPTEENKKEANWKKILSKTLKELGFIDEKFIGRIVIQVNQGGIRDLEKTERFD